MDNWGRKIVIVLLVLNAWLLLHYAPLVPKAIILMDDIHAIRQRTLVWERMADGIQRTADGIQKTLVALEKRFSFFKAEAQKRGQSWP